MTKEQTYLTQPRFLLMGFLAFMLVSNAAWASQEENAINWLQMSSYFLGGLALFLYGMEQVVKGLLAIAEKQMKNFLAKLTTNRFVGVFTGAVVTSVIQSSSVTTVLVVGFVSAGLMSVQQSVSIIMGANLGSTMTAQIIAFKITKLALWLIASGVLLQFAALTNRSRYFGQFLLGLGLIFFGMDMMSQAMTPLRDYPAFLDGLKTLQNPLLAILAGAGFTAVVQSSAATMGVVILLGAKGFIDLSAAIALALGANLGTTVTAFLATLGKSRDALRAAMVHLIFNVLGVALWFFFIQQLADMAVWLSLSDTTTESNLPREIANAHTLFNLITLAIFLPFTGFLAWLAYLFLPLSEAEKMQPLYRATYLRPTLLSSNITALDALSKEIGLMGQHLSGHLALIEEALRSNQPSLMSRIVTAQHQLDDLLEEILAYAAEIQTKEMNTEDSARAMQLLNAIHQQQAILENLEDNFMDVIRSMFDQHIQPSSTMQYHVDSLAKLVQDSLRKAAKAVELNDRNLALEVIGYKAPLDQEILSVQTHQAKMLSNNKKRLETFQLEMQLIDGHKRLHTLAKRMAASVKSEVQSEKTLESSSNPHHRPAAN